MRIKEFKELIDEMINIVNVINDNNKLNFTTMADTKKQAEETQKDVNGTIPSDRERGDSAEELIKKHNASMGIETKEDDDEKTKEKKEISKPGTITTKNVK